MSSTDLTGATAIVTGASRGFGRGIAAALVCAGAQVTGVARDREELARLHGELGDSFTPVAADAADPVTAGQLIDARRPGILVLNAGASPLARPIQQQSWQSFSRNWEIDVQHVFHWTREALLAPLAPGSIVVTVSSGAALRGSPLSGGYAGAKATVRFISAYAGSESQRDGLGAAYAAREGTDVATYLQNAGPALTPEQAGDAITSLVTDRAEGHDAYLLTAAGLRPVT